MDRGNIEVLWHRTINQPCIEHQSADTAIIRILYTTTNADVVAPSVDELAMVLYKEGPRVLDVPAVCCGGTVPPNLLGVQTRCDSYSAPSIST